MARLVLEHQGHKSEHRITGLTTIGRQSTNDVMVLADKTSRQHARIVLAGGRFILEDLGSANGTSVNGVKVEKHVLADRDEIQIGDAKLTFVDDRSANLEGQTLGNYRIHNRIGQGAMGAVYKATQISMDRIVALKVLRENLVADREFVRGFLNEARTAGKLNHPNVVRVHDFGEAGGVYYFSMEYVNGQTVEEVLKREGRIPVQRALEMTKQVTEALEHAHGLGIIHRDVKPQNIMVDRRGQVKLTDLGLARASRGSSSETGPIMGTPYYMAPELARDRRCDKRSDLYSLGASLYHMVTGRVPFDGPDAVAVINKHMNEPLVSPRKLDAGVPQAVSDLIELLMAKNPGLRPASAAELRRKIDDLLERKDVKKAAAKDDGLKLAPVAPLASPKKKAAPKPRPSARMPAHVSGGPAEPKKGVRIIKVGTSSPMLYMMIGALLVGILGIAAYVALTKKSRNSRGGSGGSSGHGVGGTTGTHDSGGGRVPGGGNGGVVIGVSQDSEAEAAKQLADIRELIRQNPQGSVFATRQLLQLIRQFRGTDAAVEAARLYREIVSDIDPEVTKILDGAATPRADDSHVAVAGGGNDVPDEVRDDTHGDTPPEPAKPKVPPRDAFRKAGADSSSGERSGDFFAARGPLVRFCEDYPNSEEELRAAELLDRLDVRIRERLGSLYKRASAFSSRSNYAEAEKLLRQVIDGDPIGDDRQLATVLLEANGAAARKAYEAVLARAKPYLDKQRFEEAGRIMLSGASRLRGTEWGGELTAAAQSAGISAAFIKSFGGKLEKSKGHSPKIKLEIGGEHPTVTLVGAGPQGLALSLRGVRMVVAWKDISTKDVSRVFGVFPPSGEDGLGLGAFLFLRGERRLARRELTRAKQGAATQDRAIALLEQLDARAKVRRIDFSNYEQAEALRLEGSWLMRGGRLTHGGSRVGTATLRGVDYRADGFQVTFMVNFLEEAGAIEVQLGPSSDKCVWFSLGSAGYQARMQIGGRSADVQDDWRMARGKVVAVTCRIEGDRLIVQAAGKGLKPLKARGLGRITGPVVFRAQGGRLAIDDITTRQTEKDGK